MEKLSKIVSIIFISLFFIQVFGNCVSSHEIYMGLNRAYMGDLISGYKVNPQIMYVAQNISGVVSQYYFLGTSLYKYSGGAEQLLYTVGDDCETITFEQVEGVDSTGTDVDG